MVMPAFGQKPADEEKPRDAYIKVINACEVRLREPWRAGLDLAFKQQIFASDIRSGEKCSYRRITYVPKDNVILRHHQTGVEVARIPATFEKGGFYTLLSTGLITETQQEVRIMILKDYPRENIPEGMAHVRVINAVTAFPLSLRTSADGNVSLSPDQIVDRAWPAGEYALEIIFARKDGVELTIHGTFDISRGQLYSGVILNSSEGGNRPYFLKSCETAERREILDQEKIAKADEEKLVSPP